MYELYLDDEKVDFSGDAPQDLSAILNILHNHLSAGNRVLDQFIVDGQELLGQSSLPLAFKVIQAHSLDQNQFYSAWVQRSLETTDTFQQKCQQFATELLSAPWSESSQNLEAYSNQLSTVAEVSSQLHQYAVENNPPWFPSIKELGEQLNASIQFFIQAAKDQDVGRLSELTLLNFLPLTRSTHQLMEKEIILFFKNS